MKLLPLSLLLLPLVGACASTANVQAVVAPERLTTIAEAPSDFEKDRRAILDMIGDYEISFDFLETVVLQPGYTRKPRKESGAYETVLLVEDTDTTIVLQHLLVTRTGFVIKHWRQDWHYEAGSRLEFAADQVWRVRPIAPERTRGAWTQCVYEVSDAPRYCGTGKWNHRYGTPTWTSDRSWRPLPRREYTTRNDYNALNVENRHSIVPGGWTHEQDNTKVIRNGERTAGTVVREFGFNDYRRITGFDFSPAYDYWEKTQGYWARVRAEWAHRIHDGQGVQLKYPLDGMDMIMDAFKQSEAVRKGETVSDDALQALFAPWVASPDTP